LKRNEEDGKEIAIANRHILHKKGNGQNKSAGGKWKATMDFKRGSLLQFKERRKVN
jgi:hypothetical protein